MLYLHSRSPPVLHRDLKSANLLVDQNWHVKVSRLHSGGWTAGLAHMHAGAWQVSGGLFMETALGVAAGFQASFRVPL